MKRSLALVALLMMALGNAAPAGAERAPVPAKPNIVDPAGDANASGTADKQGPISLDEADLLAAWFSADSKTLSVHWHLAASPVGKGIDLTLFAVDVQRATDVERVNESHCLWFVAEFPNEEANYHPYGRFVDSCNSPGELSAVSNHTTIQLPMRVQVTELGDRSTIVTVTALRANSPRLRAGRVLDNPTARTALFRWYPPVGAIWGRLVPLDSTASGRDFRMP